MSVEIKQDVSNELREVVEKKANIAETVFSEVNIVEVRKNKTNLQEFIQPPKDTLLG